MLGFIKCGDIEGMATVKGHEKWIPVLSLSNGANRLMSDTNDPTAAIKNSRVQVGGINFTKEVDSSSPKLLEAVCNGTIFPEVTIHLMRNTGGEGEKPYYEYKLQDAFIQSYDSSNSADGGGTFSTENVVLGFKTIKWSYKIVDTTGKEQGSVDTGWDLALSQPL